MMFDRQSVNALEVKERWIGDLLEFTHIQTVYTC